MEHTIALPDALQWFEGQLLSPQHLQQHDIYLHQQLTHRLLCRNPNFWGVREFRLDTKRIEGGTLSVQSIDCLMPDGLAVLYPGNYGHASLEVDLKKPLENKSGPLKVWLAVPARLDSAATLGSAVQRFDPVAGELAADENTGEGAVEINRLRPRLTLIVGDVPARYVACPIAEVVRDDKGLIRLTDYHPPLLRMGASAFLEDSGLDAQLRTLAGQLWNKVRTLAGDRSDRRDAQHDDPAGDERRALRAARYLALGLPALEVAVASGDTHPEQLYATLMNVVGAAASIGANPVPPIPDRYQHSDCKPQFDRAIQYIRDKMALIDTRYDSDAFVHQGDGVFYHRLPKVPGEVLIELKARTGQTLTDMARWLTECRIGREALMPVLKARRLTGATVQALSSSEMVLRKLPPGGAFFLVKNERIEVNGNLEDAYQPGEKLVVLGTADRGEPAAILLFRNKAEQPAAPAKVPAEHAHG
ncbi:type VI secretion system baseplate subunit TssK [Chitiniphilus shinanonensis]|uniref:type VI secretion system baseplate subunit TssK n=1 Tax=Chitiniphilus shinanonensis TaxID=553088 RepID=UPI0030747EBC